MDRAYSRESAEQNTLLIRPFKNYVMQQQNHLTNQPTNKPSIYLKFF